MTTKMEYGRIMERPNKRERFIRWLFKQPRAEADYILTFPVKTELEPGMRIRTSRAHPIKSISPAKSLGTIIEGDKDE